MAKQQQDRARQKRILRDASFVVGRAIALQHAVTMRAATHARPRSLQIETARTSSAWPLAYDDGDFELPTMAVAPNLRGAGIGRKVLLHTLRQARELGARHVFLGSNSVLANAIHLYASIRFGHVPPSQLPPLGYTRANVSMLHDLAQPSA